MTRPLDMRSPRWLGGICLVVLLWLFVAEVVVAQNLLITDYRVPISTAKSLRVNLDYNFKRIGTREVENRGSFFAAYKYFYDSLRFAYSVDATVAADRSAKTEFFSLIMHENARAYAVKDLFVGAELRRRYLSDVSEESEAEAVASVGYGRFINATPLAKAVRMEDWLLELGQLTDDLPAETMIELGQIIQREDEFRDQYGETYRQEWFEAMEGAIRESGMLKVPELDAIALLRMQEVLTRERVFDRFYGWEMSLGGNARLFESGRHTESPRQSLEATFRFSHPFGWRTQWNERATFSTPFGADFRHAYRLNVQSDLSYEMSDRIDLLLTHILSAERMPSRPAGYATTISHRVQGVFVFFVENALTLNLSGVLSRSDGAFRRTLSVTFGYRLF